MTISQSDGDLSCALEELIRIHGLSSVRKNIEKIASGDDKLLTIISNAGLHNPPEEYMFGEVFTVTEGPLFVEDGADVRKFIDEKMIELKSKLLSERWTKVYLIPFGHVVLNMHIKMTVFRTLWMETVDIFYHGNSRYSLVDRDTKDALRDKLTK